MQDPVVAVVEYTYAIGDKIIVPAGARIYGQLVQADRSGLVNVKFDEIELLDGAREKIEAIGTGLDLGPIKGTSTGRTQGRTSWYGPRRALAPSGEIAGNNSSAAFSEDDMLRERVAENIGTAGDSEVMNLNANSRVIVSVPAGRRSTSSSPSMRRSPPSFTRWRLQCSNETGSFSLALAQRQGFLLRFIRRILPA